MRAHHNGRLAQVAGAALLALTWSGAPAWAAEAAQTDAAQQTPVVTVARVERHPAPSTVVASGSLVARSEVLVSPQIDGVRIIELLAEEGDRVTQGQVLAKLDRAALDTQLAQLQASLSRSDAAIAQARSRILEAEANAKQAAAAFDRAKGLVQSGTTSKAVYDEREAATQSTIAGVALAKDGLIVAQADKTQIEAQIREMNLKHGFTEIKAPVDGLISRRTAKLGAMASAATEPLFRIVAGGEVELDGEVPDMFLPKLSPGLKVRIDGSGITTREGTVRLVSPEVNPATRQGRVRVSIPNGKDLRVGAFAMGVIYIASSDVLVVPYAAVLNRDLGAVVQVVKDGRVETRKVTVGVANEVQAQILSGLEAGETVVLRAGTLLHDGDSVRTVAVTPPHTVEAK